MKLENDAQRIIERVAGYLKPNIRAAIESGEISPEEEIQYLIEEVRLDLELKFIVVENEEGLTLKIFEPSITHSDEVCKSSGEKPVGGGEFKGGDLFWGSHSFRRKFGHDMPASPETASAILSEVEKHINSWIEEYCKS